MKLPEARRKNHSWNDNCCGSVSGVSCSVNSKDYISNMISNMYYVEDQCPRNWIDMWREKFKDDSEVLTLINRKWK